MRSDVMLTHFFLGQDTLMSRLATSILKHHTRQRFITSSCIAQTRRYSRETLQVPTTDLGGLKSCLPSSDTPGTESTTQMKPLVGTVSPHRCYILLHSDEHPSRFEPKVSTPISRELQLRVTKWGGIVNFAWEADWLAPAASSGVGPPSVQKGIEEGPAGVEMVEERYKRHAATVFSSVGGRLEIDDLTLENVDSVAERIQRHADLDKPQTTTKDDDDDDRVGIYVCTHGARDCRCGTIGGATFEALKTEVERRKKLDAEGKGKIQKIHVGAVGHVGGHVYAANVLVYPQGEWLSVSNVYLGY